MKLARRTLFAIALSASPLAYVGCTPGSFARDGGIAPSSGPPLSRVVTIDVNLTSDPDGYAPQIATLAIGDGVRFHNSDGFAHTATSIAGSAFPTAYPFDASALDVRGSPLSQGFSSGSLASAAVSRTFVADRAGRYLFGCFYHYGSPMRATIEVR